jgi:hypothetical protein
MVLIVHMGCSLFPPVMSGRTLIISGIFHESLKYLSPSSPLEVDIFYILTGCTL